MALKHIILGALIGAGSTLPIYHAYVSHREKAYVEGITRIEGAVVDFSETVIGEMNRNKMLEYMHKDSRLDVLVKLAVLKKHLNNQKEKYQPTLRDQVHTDS